MESNKSTRITGGEQHSVLELRNVVREYSDGPKTAEVLAGVDLAVGRGEMVAITGRSGSGKSTLLNLAGGLESATSGTVSVSGNCLESLSRKRLAELRRDEIGYVFQSFNLIPELTAAQNVAVPLEYQTPNGFGLRWRQAISVLLFGR